MNRFNGVCIITSDVLKLRSFYHAVLQAEARGDAGFGWIEGSGADLSFYPREGMEQMAPGSVRADAPAGCVLEFQVTDVDEAYERLLAQGAPIVKPPTTQPWGIRSVWFRDPEGNLVNFLAPIKTAGVKPALTVQEYFRRVINEKDLAACDELLAPDYVDHDAPADTPPGPESVKAYLAGLFQQYPDLRVEVEELLEEGRRVAARARWQGTDARAGTLFRQRGLLIIRFDAQGRMAERWSAYQNE